MNKFYHLVLVMHKYFVEFESNEKNETDQWLGVSVSSQRSIDGEGKAVVSNFSVFSNFSNDLINFISTSFSGGSRGGHRGPWPPQTMDKFFSQLVIQITDRFFA